MVFPVSDILPSVITSIRSLVALQHGSVSVSCPLSFYKRASGQVSVYGFKDVDTVLDRPTVILQSTNELYA